jgi:hypothetical protein
MPCVLRLLLLPGLLTAAAINPARAEMVRLNEIQVIGTHNSYHVRPADWLLRLAKAVRPDAKAWDYSHAPLDVQLDRGVRSFELDMNYMAAGYRVFHNPLVDRESTCPVFLDCLHTVRLWSETHPGHIPLSFLLEIKDEAILMDKDILPIDALALDRLDEEIRSVFPPEKLFTPDDLRGDAASLPDAIASTGWPEINAVRGKVFFILHERGRNRDIYTEGRSALEGRVMFVESEKGAPHAAFFIRNNPFDENIPRLVKAGYLVRTRADAGLVQGRTNDTRRRDAALASGAHVVTTDFPNGETAPDTGYVVRLPGGHTARCNPVSAPPECAGKPLETLPRVAPEGHE